MLSLAMKIATFRLHTASLLQAIRSTGYASPCKGRCSAVIGWFSTAVIGAFVVSVICSLGGPLSYGSPVVVFLDPGHPCYWNFYSTVPVRVKSYVNHLFDPACVTMRITINKRYIYFIPKRVLSGVVDVL